MASTHQPASRRRRRALARALGLTCWALLVLAAVAIEPSPRLQGAVADPADTPRDRRQPRILLLAADDVDRPWVQQILNGFRDVALAGPQPAVFYFESIDSSRFSGKAYDDGLRDWLSRKYGDSVDVVVPLGEPAVMFLAARQGAPWPHKPLLFLEAGGVDVDLARDLPTASGVILEDHFGAALGVVRQILPETRRVALIYGASEVERHRWRDFPDRVRSAGLEPLELAGLSMDDLLSRVARLPEDTVLYILAPYIDANGRVLPQGRACELISAAANRPSFSLPAHDLGCGVVGGLLRDFSRVGRLLAERALLTARSGVAQPFTVPMADYTSLMFDGRALARWQIADARLPAGSVVQNREPNLWRDYRGLVIAVVTIGFVQAGLIGALLFEHRRRRRAEVSSRHHLAAMAHLDRRAAMGELTTSLAHELNQPLNAILQNAGAAEMMLASKAGAADLDEIRAILADIRSDDVRAGETIRRMRDLLRKRELETETVDLNEFTRDTVALVAADAVARHVRVDTELTPTAPVLGDRIHLQQVLLNLMLNGMEAMGRTPPERRQLLVRTAQSNGTVELSVRDCGSGIPGDDPSRVFEPFFTTKPEGMGMGLSIARSIIEAHNGRITAENNVDGGATVRVNLPAAGEPDGHPRQHVN